MGHVDFKISVFLVMKSFNSEEKLFTLSTMDTVGPILFSDWIGDLSRLSRLSRESVKSGVGQETISYVGSSRSF